MSRIQRLVTVTILAALGASATAIAQPAGATPGKKDKPTDPKAAEKKPAQTKTADKKAADKKTGEEKTSDDKPADDKGAEVKAEVKTIKVSPFELARGQFDASKSMPSEIGTCGIANGAFNTATCKDLMKVTGKKQFDAVALEIEDSTPVMGTFKRSDKSITLKTVPTMATIAFLGPKGWEEAELTDGATNDKDALQAFSVNSVEQIYGLDSAEKLYGLSLSLDKTGSDSGSGGPACVDESPTDWCKAAAEDDQLICIDATAGFEPVTFTPKKHILKPNTSVSVVVRHLTSQGVEIKQLGQRGLFESTVADYTGKFYKKDNQQSEGQETCAMASHGSFAPRLPGSADIKIELRDVNDKTKVLAEHTIELEVGTTYAGAIRLGFSTVMGDAVNRAYASQLAPGSSTHEIVATETGDVNTEVVVGISAYLYDIWRSGGRQYVDRPSLSYVVPSPYLGIGVLSWKGSGLQSIPSVHLGLEWEVTKSFAFSIDALARKVTRLSDGYSVGSPVSSMSTFTTDRYEWGWAFTVSVSPEFLQFAVGSP